MLIGHYNKGQIMNAGAIGASPAIKKKNQETVAQPQSPVLEEDELDVIALAVTSDFRIDNPDQCYRVIRDRKVVYQSGVVKYSDENNHEELNSLPHSAVPVDIEPCILKNMIRSLKSSRIPVGLRGFVSEDSNVVPDRVIIEFCCSLRSKIGMRNRSSEGCRVIRITEELDAQSYSGFYLAAKGCTMKRAMLYSSMPCTGGSTWQFINKQYPSARNKSRKHRIIFHRLWKTFEVLCQVARECGAYIAIEWPTGCTYWKASEVRALIKKYGLRPVKFHGCALNMRVTSGKHAGKYLKKPWTIFTDCPNVRQAFESKLCQRNHDHAECRGQAAKQSESYSSDYVACLHGAFKRAVDGQ